MRVKTHGSIGQVRRTMAVARMVLIHDCCIMQLVRVLVAEMMPYAEMMTQVERQEAQGNGKNDGPSDTHGR